MTQKELDFATYCIGTYADMMGIDREEAMRRFYASNTYLLISEGIADMHCRSDIYLAEELRRESALI